jgi:TP901 family phage tail tape measure protein
MADVNANIDVNINTSEALAQLKSLQKQLSQFYASVSKSSATAAMAQKDLQKNLLNSINSIGQFSAEFRTIKTTTESFTDSLEKNKFSMREYFRYAGASTQTFGKLFKSEFDTIGKVAEERVKRLQTQYIKLGRDTNGAMKAMAIIPSQLNMEDFGTKAQIAGQKQQLFNQLVKQGSTNLLNFGKNTQWAGRQLMVGFTIPLTLLGNTASKVFMDMEAQTLKFRKVYGDLFTPKEETAQALKDIEALGQVYTRYGIAVSQTVGLAAEAAAAGFSGIDLQRQTAQATRLSVLGQVESQKALETTISLQNAFKMSSENLASSIDFLNAVENQTVVSLDDITTAIPKVAPVIQQLGGDVKDLAFFMAAMKEGGINASEGANALKSGLAALINPTTKASAMLQGMGINITKIIESNKGNLKATVMEFAKALDTLDPLTRARAIEQLFGKFQFARLSTLFDNVNNQTGQAARVLDLAGTSIEDLAALSESELGMTADSAMNKFRKSVEDLKFALIPVGQTFLQAITPIVEFFGGILEKFNNLSDGVKKAITVLAIAVGAIGPVALMAFGLLANGIANIIKLFLTLRTGYLRLTGQSQALGEQTQYLTMEQLDAAAAAHSLNQSHAKLTQQFNVEAGAVNRLRMAYESATRAAQNFAITNPGMMLPGRGAKKLAKGIVSVPGPKGAGDVVPAMLSPGEAVIPAKMADKYGGLIAGMVAGNIPGFEQGLVPGYTNAVTLLSSAANQGLKGKVGVPASGLASEFSQGGAGIQAPIIRAIAESLGATKPNDIVKMIGNDPNLAKFGNNISMGVAEELSKISGNVTDPELSKIYQNVARDQAKNFGQVYQDATEKFLTEITTFEDTTQQRVSQSTGRTRSIGRASLFKNKRSYRSMGFGKISEALGTPSIKGKVMAHMTGRQMINLNDMGQQGELTPAAANAIARMSGQATTVAQTSVKKSQKSKSPSKVAEQLGLDFGQGYADGIKKATPDVAASATGLTTGATTGIKKTGIKGRIGGIAKGLAGGRAGMAASTALMAGSMLPGKAGQIAGQASGIAFGLQAVGMALKVLPGPLKLVAVGMAATYGIVKLVNAAMERQRLAVEGLADAMATTTKQTQVLGDFFGVVPNKLPFDLKNREIVAAPVRSQREALKADPAFQKEFKSTIEQLRKASNEEAKLVFTSLALNLKAQGFAKEQVQVIVDSLREESAQTDVKLDVKSLGLSKESLDLIKADMAPMLLKLNAALKTGVTNKSAMSASGQLIEWTELSKGAQKELATMSEFLVEASKSASGMFELGLIDGKTYEATLSAIIQTTNGLDAANRKILLSKVFEKLGVSAKDFNLILGNSVREMKMLALLSSGVLGKDSPILKALASKDYKTQMRGVGQLNKLYQQLFGAIEKVNEEQNKTGTKTGTGTGELTDYQKLINALKAQRTETSNSIKAFNILRNSGIEVSKALELSKDPLLAMVLNSKLTKDQMNTILALIKEINTVTGKGALQDFLEGLRGKNNLTESFTKVVPVLKAAGASLEDINAIMDNPTLMQYLVDGLKDGSVKATDILNIVNELARGKKVKLEFDMSTPEGQLDIFEKGYQEAMDYFDAIETSKRLEMESTAQYTKAVADISAAEEAINAAEGLIDSRRVAIQALQDDLEYNEKYGQGVIDSIKSKIDKEQAAIDVINGQIDEQQSLIDNLQRDIEIRFDRPIAALQEESSNLSNTLSLIEKQEEAINKKYDAQEQALSRISEINQDISNQKKQQLSLADALSSGDISAAAQISQEMQASAAEASLRGTQNGLQAAREAELSGVTSWRLN